jgi:hypothetical protein
MMKKWLTLLALSAGLVSTGNAAYINRLKTFTGVASQWPWQLNADGTWTLKKPTYSDIDGATAATINFTGQTSPYMSAPLSIWNDCNGATLTVGVNCGLRVWIGDNPTATPGLGDAVAATFAMINGNNRTHLYGQNILVGQSAAISGALDGNQTGLEIDVFSDTGYTASNQPFYSSTATAGQHKNGLEVYSFPTIDLTAALSVWAQNPGQGWWSEGLSLSRVTNNGIHFYVNPEQSVTDTKAAFTNAAIFDQSNSVNVLRVSGSHAGAVIDLEDNPTLGYFVKAASGAASTIRFGNSADHNMSLSIDSGDTTAQSSALIFADRNTAKWMLSSNNTATFSIYNNGRGSSDVSLDNTTGAMTLAAAPIMSALSGYLYADPTTHVVSAATTIPLSKLAAQAANTIVGNATSGSAAPTALSIGSCSTSASALQWTTNSGFGCNTAINAATLNGATFAAPGAIGGTTPGSGSFTTITSGAGLTLANYSTIVNSANNGDISIAGGTAWNLGGWIDLRGPSHPTPNTILLGVSGGQSMLLSATGLYIGASGSASYPLDVSGVANATSYRVGGTAGVTCSGTPTASFASTNGIVTHC